ncbi:MAG: DUF2282 domain-containing protein [Candidatus Competibacteraceae bacterium]|nr:DUF2282 domain-containing protein [Candidatus Competibacteraceae bacterium]
MVKNAFNQFALAAAITGAMGLAASPVFAAESGKEKCYGISKAGENDCANAAGNHSCAGSSTTDYDGQDWKFVAKGTCAKLGGKSASFKGQGMPAKSS